MLRGYSECVELHRVRIKRGKRVNGSDQNVLTFENIPIGEKPDS